METAVNYCDRDWAYMSSDEGKWIRKLKSLAASHPDQCIITAQPEGNDGCINAKFPISWLKIQPKKIRIMTDEQKAEYAARLRNNLKRKN